MLSTLHSLLSLFSMHSPTPQQAPPEVESLAEWKQEEEEEEEEEEEAGAQVRASSLHLSLRPPHTRKDGREEEGEEQREEHGDIERMGVHTQICCTIAFRFACEPTEKLKEKHRGR